jgi:hypothetical protein
VWCGPEPLPTRARRLVAREAAAGRRSLADAAALFVALNRLPPAVDLSRGFQYRNEPTAEDRACRQVIVWADDPAFPEGAEHLEAEFAALRRRGPVRLPAAEAVEPLAALLARARDSTPTGRR